MPHHRPDPEMILLAHAVRLRQLAAKREAEAADQRTRADELEARYRAHIARQAQQAQAEQAAS